MPAETRSVQSDGTGFALAQTTVSNGVALLNWSGRAAAQKGAKIKTCAEQDRPMMRRVVRDRHRAGAWEWRQGKRGENAQGPGPLSLLRRQDYGSKEVRAERFAAQVQAGNVYLVAGGWHRDFVDELESFPYLACSTTSKSGLLD